MGQRADYILTLKLSHNGSWSSRQESTKKVYFAVSNKIVELGGTVELDKWFSFDYLNERLNIRINSLHIDKLRSMQEVHDIRLK